MTEQEERELARKLAERSGVFDFDLAPRVVKAKPVQAEKLIRNREETKRMSEEFARLREARRRALIEDYG